MFVYISPPGWCFVFLNGPIRHILMSFSPLLTTEEVNEIEIELGEEGPIEGHMRRAAGAVKQEVRCHCH